MILSTSSSDIPRAPRRRSGVSLIEVVVACTLLAVTLTVLTGLAQRAAARSRNVAYTEQRVATLYAEVNRVQSMPYDSLTIYLVTDSIKANNVWFVWSYVVDPDSTSGTGISTYKKIKLTVTPRVTGMTAQTAVVRRMRSPTFNPLNYP